jgi:CheY-like chemotaxis protein
VTLLVLVVDDEPDVEVLFRQHFRHDLRAGRFTMEFAQSGPAALQRITDAAGVSLILILSDTNTPGMSGLKLLPRASAAKDAKRGPSFGDLGKRRNCAVDHIRIAKMMVDFMDAIGHGGRHAHQHRCWVIASTPRLQLGSTESRPWRVVATPSFAPRVGESR